VPIELSTAFSENAVTIFLRRYEVPSAHGFSPQLVPQHLFNLGGERNRIAYGHQVGPIE
jgi:hypothetical protein